MKSRLGRLARLAVCLGLCAAAGLAPAREYPAKPVRILVGFAAGGSIDIVTRVIADGLAKSTGQPFIVENRPGAGGNIAVDALLKAPADGYTILMGATGIAANPALFRKVPYRIEDLAPISLVGEAPVLIMASPSVPADSLQELIALAKAKPGTIRSAIVNGTTAHLASEMFRMMAGVDITHVPYRVNSQAFQDAMGGQVEMVVLPIAESLPHVKAKRIKALAQTGSRRSSLAPQIPTVEEAGGLKGYSITAWYLALGPAKMPSETVEVLSREIDKVLKQPEVAARLNASGVDVLGTTPGEATKFLRREHEKLTKLIEWSGAKIE